VASVSATDSQQEPDWPAVRELEPVLGHEFKSISLLETALRHASYAHETNAGESNERLEFLGDSILGLVVAHTLYAAHPDWSEGDLSLTLQHVVEQRSLAKLALKLGIGPYLRLGRTERQSAGKTKPSILADAVEAILGAVYLDGGLAPVERLLNRVFESELSRDAYPLQRDSKTRFQEWVMAQTGAFPVYECTGNSEVDGADDRFTVQVRVADECWGEGTARSKRRAQQIAATVALERVDREATD
jgi:ribonuclease-3